MRKYLILFMLLVVTVNSYAQEEYSFEVSHIRSDDNEEFTETSAFLTIQSNYVYFKFNGSGREIQKLKVLELKESKNNTLTFKLLDVSTDEIMLGSLNARGKIPTFTLIFNNKEWVQYVINLME